MDTETERQIQYALERLGKGRTTISIAHRLSTLRDCDFLMVVDNGCVTEMGTHSELIEKHGTYYRLTLRMRTGSTSFSSALPFSAPSR